MEKRRAGYGWGGAPFAGALVAGALLRLLFFWLRPTVAGDALMYGDLAHTMVAHHVYGFSAAGIEPTLIRLPGYPLFLAACFAVFGAGNYAAVVAVQMVVDLAGCALLGMLAERLAGRRAGLAAIWLAALCPFTANYSVVVLAETLSVFCVVVALLALERWVAFERAWGWVMVLGCALSGAVLLRPDGGMLAAAILPVMVWVGLRRRRLGVGRRLAPVVAAAMLVVLPLSLWTARNWRVFHVIQPLAPRYANDPGEAVPFGFQRWFRTWAVDYKATYDIYWNYDDTRMRVEDLPSRAFDDAQQRERTEELFARYNQVRSATPEFDAEFAQIAAERIADHPLRYAVVLPLEREADMWLRPRFELTTMPVDWWAVRAHPLESAEEIAYALLNVAYLGLAVVGLVRWRRRGWDGHAAVAYAMLGFVALRCGLLLTLDNSEPRYTLECFPVVIVLGAIALATGKLASD
ncbi:MAG TPA: glycosyltransferase family 39 protein [Acidobacteriaceae bacterium]|nr:glycosyltransferase family 39 protein [Acidobacteriaceae bacterium]